MINSVFRQTAGNGNPLVSWAFLLAWVAALLAGGCTSIGPGTVVRDRYDYTDAIAESWKKQMLLNMVKIRYGDVPVFLDVASVINQYSLEGTLTLGASWDSDPYYSASQSVGTQGRYTDRPTITYSPMTGEKFARSLMKPIPPIVILSLIQAGYPVDKVMRVVAQSINGIRNRYGGTGRAHPGDPEFYPLLLALREIQSSAVMSMQIRRINERETAVMILRGRGAETAKDKMEAVKKMLGLKPLKDEFTVVYGNTPIRGDEIALQTRSMLEIIIELSSYIEVPLSHVEESRVNPTMAGDTIGGVAVEPLIYIHSGSERPADVFVAVSYRGTWFWIDDRDLPSKRLFSFLMFIFTLTETGAGREGAPIVTIPTG